MILILALVAAAAALLIYKPRNADGSAGGSILHPAAGPVVSRRVAEDLEDAEVVKEAYLAHQHAERTREALAKVQAIANPSPASPAGKRAAS